MTAILREPTFHICASMEVQKQSSAGLMRLKTPTMENAKTNSNAPIFYDVVDCADKYRKVSFPIQALILLRIKIKTLACSFYFPRQEAENND